MLPGSTIKANLRGGGSGSASAVSVDRPDSSAARSFRIGFPRSAFNQWDGDVVSRLPELDQDELEMVRDREEGGKNRSTILTRVEALTGAAAASGGGGGGDWGVSERHWDAWSDQGDEAEEEEPDEDAEADEEGIFPIADYDDLKAAEVVSLLPELDDDELEQVRDREERGAGRATVLNRIDTLLGVEPPPAKKAPQKKKAAAKKAPAKKRAAKKTAAKRTTAKKAAAKKTTRKSTSAKKR